LQPWPGKEKSLDMKQYNGSPFVGNKNLNIRPAGLSAPAPDTPAGKYIYRRFNVCPIIADLVASLAGLGPDRRAA